MTGGGLEDLYPFLYREGAAPDPEVLLGELRRSTAEKAAEIVALRQRVAECDGTRLAACATSMAERFAAGGRLLSFGNGGSSTDAGDLARLFLSPDGPGRPLPAVSLAADVATLTALANDVGFEFVFARQIAALGTATDIAVGFSTSGGSENVLAALEEAGRRGLLTVAFAGYDGGRMAGLAEAGIIQQLFVVPSASVHRIQEAQTTTYHVLWELVQDALGTSVVADDGPCS